MSNLFFDSKGNLNATDVKDAIAKLAKFASVMDQMPTSIEQPSFSSEQEDALIKSAIYSNEGKQALASIMANPIRQNLDYRGLGRRILAVDTTQIGVEPSYERDIDVSATVVSENGTTVESRVFGDRVKVPTFEIMSNPTVRISEAHRRRFNVIDRAVQKARQEIAAIEDANIFASADHAATVINTAQDIQQSHMHKSDLLNISVQIEQHDNITSKYLMHIIQFNDIRLWGAGGGVVGEIDPVTQREILKTGLFANLWGADILVSKMVPRGTVYAFADPEFVGVMPIREDITVYPCDEMKMAKLGWLVREEIGLAILVERGVALGRVTV